MDDLRAEHPVSGESMPHTGDDAPLWGGTVGARSQKPNGVPVWFDDIEPLYAELDELIRYAPGDLFQSVTTDERIRGLAPQMHRMRAAYERDKEIVQAHGLLNSAHGPTRLKGMMEQESYWALAEELRDVLDGSRHVLVAGSGPLPLTALCIGAALEARITCVEHDAECHMLGQRLIALTGLDDDIESINADILELTEFDQFDAIVGVVLLGVGTDAGQASSKAAIARHVIAHMSPGTRMVLRDPHGLGKLLYPSLELSPGTGVEVTRLVPEGGPTRPYRSDLVVAERRSPDTGHAH
jgi:hypothetical protein